jgi:hypothetical protein
LACLSFRERDQLGNSVQDAGIVSHGRRYAMSQEHGAGTGSGIGKRNSLNLRATQINPDSHHGSNALRL